MSIDPELGHHIDPRPEFCTACGERNQWVCKNGGVLWNDHTCPPVSRAQFDELQERVRWIAAFLYKTHPDAGHHVFNIATEKQ